MIILLGFLHRYWLALAIVGLALLGYVAVRHDAYKQGYEEAAADCRFVEQQRIEKENAEREAEAERLDKLAADEEKKKAIFHSVAAKRAKATRAQTSTSSPVYATSLPPAIVLLLNDQLRTAHSGQSAAANGVAGTVPVVSVGMAIEKLTEVINGYSDCSGRLDGLIEATAP